MIDAPFSRSIVDQEKDMLTPRQRLGQLLLIAYDLFVAYPILHLLLRAVFGDRLGLISFMNNLLHRWLLLAFPLLLLMLVLQRWQHAALASVNVIAFVWLFGELFLPNPSVPAGPDNSHTLTVMTYNVGNGLAKPEVLSETLRASGADVIALLELTEAQAAALDRDLEDVYPHRVLYGLGTPGVGLLSRYPILDETLFYLQTERFPYHRTILDVNGTSLIVIAAHPPPPRLLPPFRYQAMGSEEIASLAGIASDGNPTLLLGDFNTSDQSQDYAILVNAGLHDAFRAAGWGFGATFPSGRMGFLHFTPVTRIDYIWYTEHFHATRAWVGPDAGSDHLPVLAELVWRPQEHE